MYTRRIHNVYKRINARGPRAPGLYRRSAVLFTAADNARGERKKDTSCAIENGP